MPDPQLVRFVSGEVEPAGRYLSLRIEVAAGNPIDLQLAATDISAFSNLLLLLGLHASAQRPELKASQADDLIPLPVQALSVGELIDGTKLLVMEVGATSLAFALPSEGIEEIGQAFMTMSASADRHSA